ncbi:MAG TPA: biotin/lipoyl-binding protein, partial [Kofleriaceae bacterium]
MRETRSRRPAIMVSIGLIVLVMWLAWGRFADVAVYRSSSSAKLETDPPPSRVASNVTGTITHVGLHTGDHVNKNDVLLQLDPTQTQISVDKARGRIAALGPQVESLARELSLQADEVLQRSTAERGGESELLARLRGAEADLSSAEHELALETDAVKASVSPVVVRDRAAIVVQQKRAAV